MSCKYAFPTDEHHGWGCTVTDGACMFVIPDSIACAIEFQEGPDADKTPEQLEAMKENSPMNEMCKRIVEVFEEEDSYTEIYDDPFPEE